MKTTPNEPKKESIESSRDQRIPVFLVLGLILLSGHLFDGDSLHVHRPEITPDFSPDSVFVWLSGSKIDDGLYRISKKLLPPLADSFDQLYLRMGLKPPPSIAGPRSHEFNPGQEDVSSPLLGLTVEDSLPPTIIPAPPHLAQIFFLPVSINRADKELLTSLPGIGPRLAERIIALREEKGAFQDQTELLAVPGIGQTKLNRLLKRVSFQ